MRKAFVVLSVCFLLIIIAIVFAKSYLFVTQKSQRPAIRKEGSMKIASNAFGDNQMIPVKFTCSGEDINPPLLFENVPKDAKSLVLIVDDPDAPLGTFVHWVVYNMAPTLKGIGENMKPEGIEGKNGAGKNAYMGPCPPSGTHHYHFKLYALDSMLDFTDPAAVDKKAVEEKMQGHILEQAELVGLYSKQ